MTPDPTADQRSATDDPPPIVSFAEAARVVAVAGGFEAEVPAEWAQGRTAFGGLAAGILVNAVQLLPEVAGLPVRSIDAAFIAPVRPGPVRVTARVLRQGKNLTHASAELSGPDDDQPLSSVHVVLGRLRESAVVVPPAPPSTTSPDECLLMPYIEGLTPTYTKNLEFRFASGIPYTGSTEAEVTGWCRHRNPESGVAAIGALVDAWPGTVLPLMTAPAPASTVRWNLQFPGDDAEEFVGDEWCWYRSGTVTAAGGYSVMTAELWQGERLLSWSEQLLAVFDR